MPSPPFDIVLSPPPFDGSHIVLSESQQPQMPPHQERQQSVGYNLQHEFETLNHDLDLDLTYGSSADTNAITNSNTLSNAGIGGSGGGAASKASAGANPGASSTSLGGSVGSGGNIGGSTSGNASGAAAAGSSAAGAKSVASRTDSGLIGSQYNNFVTPTANSILRDTTLSPAPSTASSAAALATLLNNHSTNNFLPPLASIPNRPQSVQDFSFSSYQQQQHQQQQPSHLSSNHSGGLGQPQPHHVASLQAPAAYQPPSSQFYSDLLTFGHWIENLSHSDTNTMLDHLCNTLPLDVLVLFKSKLENHLNPYKGLSYDMERVSLDDFSAGLGQHQGLHQQQHQQQQHQNHQNTQSQIGANTAAQYHQTVAPRYDTLQQPKPKPNYRVFEKFDKSRPKSADPHTRFADRARSPTSHLYEKTSFLQLAAGSPSGGQQANALGSLGNSLGGSGNNNNNSNISNSIGGSNIGGNAGSNSSGAMGSGLGGGNNSGGGPGNNNNTHSSLSPNSSLAAGSNDDLSGQAALKLGALATINSRVALDSNRKNFRNYEQQIGRFANSASVPVPGVQQSQQQQQQQQQQGQARHFQAQPQTQAHQSQAGYPQRSATPTTSEISSPLTPTASTASGNSSSMPAEIANIDLLNNIPAWLKVLRLHKYTDCLKDIPWKELIELDDETLEEKGVKALGARRKLLKAFDAVKLNIK